MDTTEFLRAEIWYNEHFQKWFEGYEHWMEYFYTNGTTHNLTFFVIPFLSALNIELANKLNVHIIIGSLASNLFKWVYHGDRPYWWTRENDGPSLQQFKHTCETSPGYPSDDITSLTIFLVLCGNSLQRQASESLGRRIHPVLKILLGLTFGIPLLMTSASRIFYGCNFIHQLAGGVASGLITTYIIYKFKTYLSGMERYHFIVLFVIFLNFAIDAYYAMIHFKYDPHWSVRMAFKYCVNPEYLKHETTNIYILSRDLGAFLGLAMAGGSFKRKYSFSTNQLFSVPAYVILMYMNNKLFLNTPKAYGRFTFLFYEFSRSAIYFYIQLKSLPDYFTSQDVI